MISIRQENQSENYQNSSFKHVLQTHAQSIYNHNNDTNIV